MLIYIKGWYLPLIAEGTKTTTIRLWKVCNLLPGRTLTFNGRIRVTLTRVEHRRLGDLDDDDARLDGFSSRRALITAIREHYPGTSLDRMVWVLTFARPILLRPTEKLSSHIRRA
jgi:hypothetical protein